MTASERRKIMCSVTFHVIAITCVVWSLYVLIDRTAEEIKQGQVTGECMGHEVSTAYWSWGLRFWDLESSVSLRPQTPEFL